MTHKREIIYPFFLECCQYTEDDFWMDIFEDLAYGKAPYGAYIHKDSLCCAFKGKEFAYKIARKDPKELYDDIYRLSTEKLGILSQREKIQKKLTFNELEKNIRDSRHEWAGIRKKNIKDIMYEKYALEMRKKHKLSLQQTKYLLALISIAIMFKTITSKDISFDGNRIEHIKGIRFEERKVILERPLCSPGASVGTRASTSAPEIDEEISGGEHFFPFEEQISVKSLWEKFVKTLRKRHV